jgi:hypothetical protein
MNASRHRAELKARFTAWQLWSVEEGHRNTV